MRKRERQCRRPVRVVSFSVSVTETITIGHRGPLLMTSVMIMGIVIDGSGGIGLGCAGTRGW